MIEIRSLTKCFGEQVVLRDISLRVGPETVGLLGTNGSGKTTLFKCILGLLEYDGEILINGRDIRSGGPELKQSIGYIPQYLPVWRDISVAEAMSFFGEVRKIGAKRQAELLDEFGLGEHRSKKIGALSGGMRQKLSIGIALLSDPDVLLLDEPTANLDAWATQEILAVLQKLRGRKTIILSSHRLEEVMSVADRLIQVKEGALIAPELAKMQLIAQQGAVKCEQRY